MSARGLPRKTEASLKPSSFKPKNHKVIHNSGAGVEQKRVKIKQTSFHDPNRRKSNEIINNLLSKKTDGAPKEEGSGSKHYALRRRSTKHSILMGNYKFGRKRTQGEKSEKSDGRKRRQSLASKNSVTITPSVSPAGGKNETTEEENRQSSASSTPLETQHQALPKVLKAKLTLRLDDGVTNKLAQNAAKNKDLHLGEEESRNAFLDKEGYDKRCQKTLPFDVPSNTIQNIDL